MKVLMVCLGNICRSPLAHGILEELAPKDWVIDSAGTSSWHEGERPDTRSIITARTHGIDIDHQRSRPVEVSDFEKFDVIFAMDSSNHSNLMQLAPSNRAKAKIRLIMNEAYPEQNLQVPDPYTGGDEGFEQVYQMLKESITTFLQHNA
jgi:protein-tyrosine phosphatase